MNVRALKLSFNILHNIFQRHLKFFTTHQSIIDSNCNTNYITQQRFSKATEWSGAVQHCANLLKMFLMLATIFYFILGKALHSNNPAHTHYHTSQITTRHTHTVLKLKNHKPHCLASRKSKQLKNYLKPDGCKYYYQ